MIDAKSKPRRQSFGTKKPHKELRFGSYVLGSTLGEGEFGKVKLGWRKDGQQPSQVAIKFIRRESIPRGSDRESKVHREINALKRLSHPNIIKLEEVLQNDKYIGIVLEYASGGELFDYILQHRYLKDSLACRLFAQLVSGVHYMHSKGIVHRDLKLENLLLDKHKNIVITDFGFVNSFGPSNELMKTSCGSPCYAAPELVISNEPYKARKADVWSCGVILYAMLAGYLPFDDDPQNPDGDNIARLYQYITTTHLTFPEYIEPISRDLLRRILVPNPKKRLSLREVRSHQWLVPHAPFLSVTPSEWDVNYQNSQSGDFKQQQPQLLPQTAAIKGDYRRYSLMDTTGFGQISSQSQNQNHLPQPSYHHHSASTSNTQFFANPLPPQTSSNHAIALPSSTSSNSINEQLKQSPRAGHQRSNSVQSYSSASLALQAVVDANDVRYHQQSSSIQSSSSLVDVYHLDSSTSFTKQNSHSLQLQQQGLPRSSTHTGITTMAQFKEQLANYTIEESPVKTPMGQLQCLSSPPEANFVKPKIPINNNFSFPNLQSQKLPGPGARKPRPTSYHPGLYSNTNPQSTESYPHTIIPENQINYSFQRSESTTSVSSLTNCKISKPYVDLASAEGNIIIPRSPNLINAKVYNQSPERVEHESKETSDKSLIDQKVTAEQKKANRYSAIVAAELVMDKLFGASHPEQIITNGENTSVSHHSSIHIKTPSSTSTTSKNSSVSNPSANNINSTSVVQQVQQVKQVEQAQAQTQQVQPVQQTQQAQVQQVEQAQAQQVQAQQVQQAQSQQVQAQKVQQTQQAQVQQAQVQQVQQAQAQQVQAHQVQQAQAQQVQPVQQTQQAQAQAQQVQAQQAQQAQQVQQVKQVKQAQQAQQHARSLNTQNKTKRFSFLSFYSSNENECMTEAESNHSNRSNKKKVLEPSNDLNRRQSSKNKRDSILSYTSFAPKKEPSTAKKVIDFFKRRSMRV